MTFFIIYIKAYMLLRLISHEYGVLISADMRKCIYICENLYVSENVGVKTTGKCLRLFLLHPQLNVSCLFSWTSLSRRIRNYDNYRRQ